MAKQAFLGLIVLFILLTGLLPLLSMLIKSVYMNGHFTFSAYTSLLDSTRQWTLMGHSMLLATLATLLSLVFGVPMGLLFQKTNLPLRRFLAILFVIPLLVPPYIFAVSWSGILDGETVSQLFFGLPGSTFVLFSIFLPIPMLLTIVFLRTINPRLEEAGRLVSGWKGVIGGITLPLLFPSLLLSAMLVFILAFGEITVPAYLRYDVFPAESFIAFTAFYDFGAATAAAVPLAAVTLILLLAETFFLAEKTYRLRPSSATGHLPPIGLGKWRWPLFLAVSSFAFIIVILPIAYLVIESAGTQAYSEAFQKAGDSMWRSMGYAMTAAVFLTFIGFFTGYLIRNKTLCCWRAVDALTIFLFALPGTVIAIGLISLWNTPWTNAVYGSSVIIILGYIAKYTAMSSRITVAQLMQISPSMEEAAQAAGAGWFRRMILILLPLSGPGLLAAWLTGYIFSMRDTGIVMMLYPPGHETLTVRIFTLMANGSPPLVAALCVMMIVSTLLPVGVIWLAYRLGGRKAFR